MKRKTSNKLFMGQYQHKIVLVCPGISIFRGGDFGLIQRKLDACTIRPGSISSKLSGFRVQEDLDYARKLCKKLWALDAIEIRVESPRISIYTNNKRHIAALSGIDESRVKYIMSPPAGSQMEVDTIIMPKMNYDYRITVGATTGPNESFISWADANVTKVKLTKSCRKQLLLNHSYGCGHFYITGEKTLLMAKVHLGSSIIRIERIVKK